MARVLLIHGACHGAWCWRGVIPPLEARGHEVVALDMPGRGDGGPVGVLSLADHAGVILDAAGDGAVLVGHSAGGFSISAAAEADPGRALHLVYVAALLPQDGATLVGTMRGLTEMGPRARFLGSEDRASYIFDKAGAAEKIYNGMSEADIAWALERVCYEPAAPHNEPIHLTERFAGVEKSYVCCTEDRMIPAVDQARMALGVPEANRHELATGHSPFLSMPVELAGIIARIAEG